MQTLEQQSFLITEEQIVTPIKQVLEAITPGNEPLTVGNIPKTLTQSLDDLFPEQQYEEKDLKEAKELLGKLAREYTTEDLRGAIIEIQYLAQAWLDDFERSIFKGLTLKEVLHEKGRV